MEFAGHRLVRQSMENPFENRLLCGSQLLESLSELLPGPSRTQKRAGLNNRLFQRGNELRQRRFTFQHALHAGLHRRHCRPHVIVQTEPDP